MFDFNKFIMNLEDRIKKLKERRKIKPYVFDYKQILPILHGVLDDNMIVLILYNHDFKKFTSISEECDVLKECLSVLFDGFLKNSELYRVINWDNGQILYTNGMMYYDPEKIIIDFSS